MKKVLLVLMLALVVTAFGCKKKEAPVAVEETVVTETVVITDNVTDNGSVAPADSAPSMK